MIDVTNGYVRFPDGLILSPSMTVQDLPETWRDREYRSGIEGRRMFPCGSHEARGQRWGVAAIFVGQIDQVLLQLQSDSLDDWTLDNERIRNRQHVEYIREAFRGFRTVAEPGNGLRVEFPWGFVACTLDLRGVQALLQVKYGYGNAK
ncbi:hypothetical protein [Luteibacter sp.]|uniref:hypothetical protein n=1 Tax=Luteibacter sp. TaxID=1886636 RepID=UPI003F814353